MKKIILFGAIYFFLFPIYSFSKSFKCEFTPEMFQGGKGNEGSCSMNPEYAFSPPNSKYPEKNHCQSKIMDSVTPYTIYNDLLVDLEKGTVSWTEISGTWNYPANKNTYTINKFGKIKFLHEYLQTGISQTDKSIEKSILIIFGNDAYSKEIKELNEYIYTLYIPPNGKAIITTYDHVTSDPPAPKGSWVTEKFGKCVKFK